MEVADEQLDTIGKTFLGLSLGCARCHDHKFDPVPTEDYYAMAGIFTSTDVMERRYMLGQQRVMERLVGLGAEGDALDAGYELFWRELPALKSRIEHAKSALAHLEKGEEEALAEVAKAHAGAVAEAAVDTAAPAGERLAAQKAHVAALDAASKDAPPIPPRAMIPREAEEPGPERVRIAGQFDQPGESVPRGFLQIFTPGAPPAIPEGSSGRLELARWLTDVEGGAGALTARVLANRVWHHLIGRGLVKTVDNFGRTGEAPTHPDLLDHLAADLVASGWSLKTLIRKIATSRTFALSTGFDARSHATDPENKFLWRAHRRRLDPESLRDAMLVTAGTIDLSQPGSTVAYLGDQATAVGKNENRRRTDYLFRSAYLPVIRNDLPEIFEAFDFADAHATTGARPRTTSPVQALFLLNDESVMDSSAAAADRLLTDPSLADAEARIDRLFALALTGAPSTREREALAGFLASAEEAAAREGHENPEREAWVQTCHSVFSMSRFQFLD
jgi:hypothetical protein